MDSDQATYPLIHSEGDVRVVFPDSVRAVIEVKTNLKKGELHKAIENIRKAKELDRRILGFVFAFDSNSPETVAKNLKTYQRDFSMKYAPEIIVLLDKKAAFLSSHQQSSERGSYRLFQAEDEATILTFMFLRILDTLARDTAIAGTLSSVANGLLAETKMVDENVVIGIANR